MMDADTANMRLKWIMAIEAHVLELKQQGGTVMDVSVVCASEQRKQPFCVTTSRMQETSSEIRSTSSNISKTVSSVSSADVDLMAMENLSVDADDGEDGERDSGVMFAALGSKKLSRAEIEILECIHTFIDAWMLGKEDVFRRISTEGSADVFLCIPNSHSPACCADFTLTVHAAEFLVTSNGKQHSWDMRTRAFTTPLGGNNYSLSSLCILSSTRAIASLFLFSATSTQDATPIEDFEVTFRIAESRDKVTGVVFDRIDVTSIMSGPGSDNNPVRESLPLVAAGTATNESADGANSWGLVGKKDGSSGDDSDDENAPYGVDDKRTYSELLQYVKVPDIAYMAGTNTALLATGNSNPAPHSPTSPSTSTGTSPSTNVDTGDAVPQFEKVGIGSEESHAGLKRWMASSTAECKAALSTLLEWTDSLKLDKQGDSVEVVKYSEYLVVPDCVRKLTKNELDAHMNGGGGGGEDGTNGSDSGDDRNSTNSARSVNTTLTPSRSSNSITSRGVLSFKTNELVNISVQLPSVPGLQSVTLNFAVPISNTVSLATDQFLVNCI
jgi:hypothetical protein